MAGLELRFLGDFEVRRDGRAAPLPPSKKTRALLAYLCLQPRRFSREHLCQLLWEVPLDPRGSLRWSLSKLRNLLDDKKHARVLADRASVGVETEGVSIDMLEQRRLVTGDPAKVRRGKLEQARSRSEELLSLGDKLRGGSEEPFARANVLVGRRFEQPVAFEEVQAAEQAGASCLLTHRVQRVRTYLSDDRRRMVSLYQAPDAESVRLALHDASMPVERVWAFRQFSG